MQAVNAALAPGTEERYQIVAERLLQAAERALGRPWTADPRAAVDFHGERRETLGRATWRQYRAALVWFLARNGHPEAARYTLTLSESPCLRRSQRTSAKKSKRLPQERLESLIEALGHAGGQYDRAIGLWLLSNYYVGLRPEEWWAAEWAADRKLRVRNAKDSQDRTFGEYRTLDLQAFSAREMAVVQEFLQIVAANPDREPFYTACRKRLCAINKRLWPRAKLHITLYSGRHQFAADHKAAGRTPEELAALLGHGSTLTADRHYARRQHGRSRSPVSPAQEDVERVRERNEARPTPRPEFQTPRNR